MSLPLIIFFPQKRFFWGYYQNIYFPHLNIHLTIMCKCRWFYMYCFSLFLTHYNKSGPSGQVYHNLHIIGWFEKYPKGMPITLKIINSKSTSNNGTAGSILNPFIKWLLCTKYYAWYISFCLILALNSPFCSFTPLCNQSNFERITMMNKWLFLGLCLSFSSLKAWGQNNNLFFICFSTLSFSAFCFCINFYEKELCSLLDRISWSQSS